MTTPKIKTTKAQGSRFYVHPETEAKAIGVTSVLNMLPKEFLKFWAAKLVAETAVDNAASWIGIALAGDREGAVDYLKRAPMRNTGQAATRGSDAHDIFESLAEGKVLGKRDVHPDMRWAVDHFQEWLDIAQPTFLHLEKTVWSETHGYAGSFDAIASFEVDGETSTVILDWKTTRSGVHPEVALQLSAYASADYILETDGSQTPLPELDGAGVLWVVPEEWKFVPVSISPSNLEIFLALKEVFEWEKNLKKSALGRPIWAGGE